MAHDGWVSRTVASEPKSDLKNNKPRSAASDKKSNTTGKSAAAVKPDRAVAPADAGKSSAAGAKRKTKTKTKTKATPSGAGKSKVKVTATKPASKKARTVSARTAKAGAAVRKRPSSTVTRQSSGKTGHTVPASGISASLTEAEKQSAAFQRQKSRMAAVGIQTESCDGRKLGLSRFSSRSKIAFKDYKSNIEQIYNPFGDPWASRRSQNRFIPVATSSCRRFSREELGRRGDTLSCNDVKTRKDYINYASRAGSAYHYDETAGRLNADMKPARELKRLFTENGINKKIIGYTVLNYNDGTLFSPSDPLPEEFFLHYPEHSREPKDRLKFVDGGTLIASGDVFDIREPKVRTRIVGAVIKRMIEGELDALLVDYAARRYAFGLPTLIDKLPQDWTTAFQEHQHSLMGELYRKIKASGKELLLNGMMLDSIVVTEPTMIQLFAKVCDGLFWEQPFRWEWRDYDKDGVDYYQRIEQFLNVAKLFKKKVFFKIGSYRYHGTEDVAPSWKARFKQTNWGIERHLAEHLTCMFLLFANRHYHTLIYTQPTEIYDIFCSEAYFGFWDKNIGEPVSDRKELSKHVHMRVFERGLVLVNNTLKAATVKVPIPEHWGGTRTMRVKLKPLSGHFHMRESTDRFDGLRRAIRNSVGFQALRKIYHLIRA